MALVDLKSKLNEFGKNNPKNPYQKGDRETDLKSNVKIDNEKYLEKGQKRKSDLTNQGSKLDRENTPKSVIPRKESNTLLSFGRSIKSFIQDFGLSAYDVPTTTNYEDTIKRESADRGGFPIVTENSDGQLEEKRVTLGSISRDIKSIGSSIKSAKEILKGNVSKGIKTAIEGTQENKLREYNAKAYGIIKHMGEPGRKVSNVDGTLANSFEGPIKGGVKSKNVNRANMQPIEEFTDDGEPKDKDLIPFRFKSTDPITGSHKYITFSAILSGITDTITPEYSDVKYIGRPDNVYLYQGATRAVSFTFDVYPQTRQEMPRIWEKVNYLVSLCYPNWVDTPYPQENTPTGPYGDYTPKTMTSPICELTIGDLYRNTPGYLSGVTMTVVDGTTWEYEEGMKLPHYCQIAVEFVYIGKHLPQVGGTHFELNWIKQTMSGETNVNLREYFSPGEREKRLRDRAKTAGEHTTGFGGRINKFRARRLNERADRINERYSKAQGQDT